MGRGKAGKLWAMSPRASGWAGVWVFLGMYQDTSKGPAMVQLEFYKGQPATVLIGGKEREADGSIGDVCTSW